MFLFLGGFFFFVFFFVFFFFPTSYFVLALAFLLSTPRHTPRRIPTLLTNCRTLDNPTAAGYATQRARFHCTSFAASYQPVLGLSARCPLSARRCSRPARGIAVSCSCPAPVLVLLVACHCCHCPALVVLVPVRGDPAGLHACCPLLPSHWSAVIPAEPPRARCPGPPSPCRARGGEGGNNKGFPRLPLPRVRRLGPVPQR